MIHNATILLDQKFTESGLKHSVSEVNTLSYVEAGFSGNNTTVKIRLISADEDNDVKIMSEDFAKYPPNKLQAGYALINELNRKYKYAKFCIDNDGGLSAQYDLPLRISTENLGDVSVEIVIRFSKIIDDIYPEVMKSIWA